MEDNCQDFEIGYGTRVVAEPSDMGVIAVEGDEAVRPIKITVPRWYHGTDLSEFGFRVNYVNAANESGACHIAEPEVMQDEVRIVWTPSRHVTAYRGIVQFGVCARRLAAGSPEVEQEWNSQIAEFEVEEGLSYDPDPVEEEARLDWAFAAARDCADAAREARAAAEESVEMARYAIRNVTSIVKMSETPPMYKDDGAVWLVTDDSKSEITAIRRWDSELVGFALVPSATLTPSASLVPNSSGDWVDFKIAATALA